MNNTTENKERLYTQYWGQRVLVDVTNGGEECLCPVERSNVYRIDESHLELKDIVSITDEDLLRIAELLSWRKSMQETSIIVQTKELLLSQSQTNLYREHWSDIVDKVRELGYAHKWNGVTVENQIEYGWIKLKSE
ncbi:hypothetical protein [Chryseobacterium sp.]|jgi:hypothetical protein|uniref:hypothetical protein n=1 Tax=Chryseobacterium sp. TaxID=1871047 RepID=UPI00284A3833|nr:hypothetical protein [Chryseobacterium sp.]MDR3026070.1 hypothetical protein [Chryseobacterium sp.]